MPNQNSTLNSKLTTKKTKTPKQKPLECRVYNEGSLQENLLSLESNGDRPISVREGIQGRINNYLGKNHDLWWGNSILTNDAMLSAQGAENLKFVTGAGLFNGEDSKATIDEFLKHGFLVYGNGREESNLYYTRLFSRQFFLGDKLTMNEELSRQQFLDSAAFDSLDVDANLRLIYADVLKQSVVRVTGVYTYHKQERLPGFNFPTVAHRQNKLYSIEFPLMLQAKYLGSRIACADIKNPFIVIGVPKQS